MYNILKDYVCTAPFSYLEIHETMVYGCCPTWMPIPYGSVNNLSEVWNSEIAQKTRVSVLDGTYSYCSKTECPYLSQLISQGSATGFTPKSTFNTKRNNPVSINMAFDRSCNLQCPSCRKDIIMADSKELEVIDEKLNDVIDVFGKDMELLYLCGGADPFASKTIRNLLLNYDRSKLPKVKVIHIHTNGLLLNEEMWEKLSPIHDLIKTIEISVDAATEETYNKIRVGGNWNILMKNLEFISSLKLSDVRLSFVTQDTNYSEMEAFYNMKIKIFGYKRSEVYYGKISNWGTYSKEQYSKKQIWNESHPEFELFLEQLRKINGLYKVRHNMYDIIEKYNLKPIVNRLI